MPSDLSNFVATLRRSVAVAVAALALAGCRFGADVAPTPMIGDPPETVAIWPFAAGGRPASAELWFTQLAYQLGERGYRVVAPGVARELLLASDLVGALDDPAAVGRALSADAVLHLEVRTFEAESDGALQRADWDLVWRMTSTRGHGQQWEHASTGRYRQADRDPLDATRGFDPMAEPPPIVPMGGRRIPGFRDARELLAYLNRAAMARLPERARP